MMLPGTHDTCQAAEALGIWSKSTQKKAAWEFLKWYASPENEVVMFKERGRPPPRLSALQLVLEQKLVQDWDIEQWMNGAKRIVPHPQPPWTALFWDLQSDAMNKMAKGAVPVERALNELESKAKELRAQYE